MNIDISPTSSLNLTISTSDMSSLRPTSKTIYFGYGSNLWRHQMRQRCPTSRYLGIARLKGYKWIIYERGYANIVELDEEEEGEMQDYKKEVWGLVYELQEEDERRLDGNEGVPVAYQKEGIECEFWATSESDEDAVLSERVDGYIGGSRGKPDLSKKAEKVDMLVYINRKLTEEGEIKEEYVYRMNMGIRDAVREGMPEGYVRQVLRKWVKGKGEAEAEEVVRRRVLEEEDER